MEEGRFYSASENAIEWLRGDDSITVTLSDPTMANKVRKLAKKNPDIVILADGPENGGYLYAHLPLSFLRIQQPASAPPVSAEHLAAINSRLSDMRDAAKVHRTVMDFDENPAPNNEKV